MLLRPHPTPLAVCRLDASSPWPSWPAAADFVSVTRTPDELSVVCDERCVPEGVRREGPWRALAAAGPLPFSAVGILASLLEPLARAEVSVFTISTFETDWLLVRAERLDDAIRALRRAGHTIDGTGD